MTIYMVAQTAPPTIWCPPWCDQLPGDHLADLDGWEGRAVHVGHWLNNGARSPDIGLGRTLLPSGEPDRERPNSDCTLMIEGRDYTLDEAEQFLRTLAEAIAAGRAEEARTR